MATHNPAPPRMTSPPAPALDDTQPVPTIVPAPMSLWDRLWMWTVRLAMLAVTGAVMLLILAVLFVTAHEVRYGGRVYPGVSTYGIDLSGMTYEEAIQTLNAQFAYDDETVFTLRDGDRTWQMTAGELGVSFDATESAQEALLQGRSSGLPQNLLTQADIWFNGRALPPIIVYDQNRAQAMLDSIAWEINRATQDATLVLMGTSVLSDEGQVGRVLDTGATLALLRQKIMGMEPSAEVPLVINETPPHIWSVVEPEAKLQAALAGPLQLYAPDAPGIGPWAVTPEQVAAMLTVQRVDYPDGTGGFEVRLDPEQFQSFLDGIAGQLSIAPQPARYHFDTNSGQLVVIRNSVNGRGLDIDKSLTAIEEALFTPPGSAEAVRDVPLAFDTVIPDLNDNVTAEELGIRELVSEATTYYLGSTVARQQNIREAASRFDGVMVAPNEEFSFNYFLGDVSLESGFEESLIIIGGRTIQGVGGGVCQVSTTVFQAAFYGGFPIVERYPHGYRVGYYEYGEGVGMDATVYSPIVDFRFVNDTPYYLLIETYTNPDNATVTYRFYSTDVGREVVKVGPRIANVEAHGPTIYEENPSLRPGQTRQVEWAVDGADVTVTRQVWRNGELESEDHFFSRYVPWQAVIQVAPGELPGQTPAAENPNTVPLEDGQGG